MPGSLDVALLHPCYFPEVHRGGERSIRDTADGLLARGHRPTLITSHPARRTLVEEDGLTVLRMRRPPRPALRPQSLPPYLTHVPLSYRALLKGTYDLAHAFYPTDALASAAWARRTGRPAILTYTGVAEPQWLASWRWGIEISRMAARGSAVVVAGSQMAATAFERWLGHPARVIHPGVNLGAFSPDGARAAEPTIICAADAGDARKRVDLLVRAFARVRKARPTATLLIPRPRVAALAADLAAEPGVELFEPTPTSHDLAPLYRRAWASVLPSAGEAFGLVLVEALACGTPVVGSRLGAIPEVVDRPTIGRLFSEEDPIGSLAHALHETFELAADPATERACLARAEDFSIERSVDAYVGLYRELLA